MPQEIERKFLVKGDFLKDVSESHHIMQGYLCSDPHRTVRVRVLDSQGFITIKGRPQSPGHFAKYEWEKEIPVVEAEELMRLCDEGTIDKIRHIVPYEGHIFEVDEFHASNEGLIMAEIELTDENENFARPAWLGEEVTFDPRFYNSYLRIHPYPTWK